MSVKAHPHNGTYAYVKDALLAFYECHIAVRDNMLEYLKLVGGHMKATMNYICHSFTFSFFFVFLFIIIFSLTSGALKWL